MSDFQEETFDILNKVNVKALVVPNALLLCGRSTPILQGPGAGRHDHGPAFLLQCFMDIKMTAVGIDAGSTAHPAGFAKGSVLEEIDVEPFGQVLQSSFATVVRCPSLWWIRAVIVIIVTQGFGIGPWGCKPYKGIGDGDLIEFHQLKCQNEPAKHHCGTETKCDEVADLQWWSADSCNSGHGVNYEQVLYQPTPSAWDRLVAVLGGLNRHGHGSAIFHGTMFSQRFGNVLGYPGRWGKVGHKMT